MDGRVKTLHPRVHGGILARGPRDQGDLERLGARRDRSRSWSISIRSGGWRPTPRPPTSRSSRTSTSAARRWFARRRRTTRASRWCAIRRTTRASSRRSPAAGDTTAGTRAELAAKAFAHTAAYDAAISGYLSSRGSRRHSHAIPSLSHAAVRARVRLAVRRESAPGGGLLRRARRAAGLARARREPGRGRQGALLQQPGRRGRGARRRARVRCVLRRWWSSTPTPAAWPWRRRWWTPTAKRARPMR